LKRQKYHFFRHSRANDTTLVAIVRNAGIQTQNKFKSEIMKESKKTNTKASILFMNTLSVCKIIFGFPPARE
jgi:hypothetical protein